MLTANIIKMDVSPPDDALHNIILFKFAQKTRFENLIHRNLGLMYELKL